MKNRSFWESLIFCLLIGLNASAADPVLENVMELTNEACAQQVEKLKPKYGKKNKKFFSDGQPDSACKMTMGIWEAECVRQFNEVAAGRKDEMQKAPDKKEKAKQIAEEEGAVLSGCIEKNRVRLDHEMLAAAKDPKKAAEFIDRAIELGAKAKALKK